MKKVFSLFVATAMSLTMMVATASAADIDGIHDASAGGVTCHLHLYPCRLH